MSPDNSHAPPVGKTASPSYEEPTKNVAKETVLPASKARAGLKDRDTLYMLLIATALTVFALAVIFIVYSKM